MLQHPSDSKSSTKEQINKYYYNRKMWYLIAADDG